MTPRREEAGGRGARARSAAPEPNLNLNVRGLLPSATLLIQEQCEALRREGQRVFRLGLGQSPFPVPRPVVEALRAHAHEKAYLATRGLPELREAVAGYHHRSQRLAGSAEDVLIGPGSKELMFLLQLVYYGDVLIPTPAWVSYSPQAQIIGRKVCFLPSSAADGWRLTPESLAEACAADRRRPRILVLNYPSNPSGCTYSAAQLEALAAVARDQRIVVLSDEIYSELHFTGRHVSIARFYPEGTIVSAGLSKWCGAGGWRLGTFFFPRSLRWLLDAMAAVASETYTSTSAPIQFAAVRAFKGGLRIERYLANSRRILGALLPECARRLRAGGVAVVEPEGAFYLFADFSPHRERLKARGIATCRTLCERLLADTGVAILPGADFGRAPAELTARLACVDFDGARALAAAEQIPAHERPDVEFLESCCNGVLEAMDRIVAWLGGDEAPGRGARPRRRAKPAPARSRVVRHTYR